jgi:drug/metabolite transporter, DME family
MDHKIGPRILIVLAAVLWSSSGLFAKAPLFDIWPAADRGLLLAFWRALFAGVLLLPAVRRPRWNVGLVPMALCFTCMNVTFMRSMTLTTAANAIWLQSTAPLWVFVFGLLFYRESHDRRDLIPLGFGLVGVALILAFELGSSENRSLEGVIYGLLAGIFYAAVIVSMRFLRGQNGAWLVAVNHLTAAAVLAPFCLHLGYGVDAQRLGVLACFGLFQMGLPYLLIARGLRDVPSQEASGIALIEPVLLPIWVYLAWGEQPAWWTIAGGALILAGLILRYSHTISRPTSD